jgi:lysophospholipase L1-like esterase
MALLGPLLWIQGKYVQKTTPLLPEPPGDRMGEVGQGPNLRLLVVGDSSAAGVGARHQDEALLGGLISVLAQSHRVEFRLEATTGSTTAGTVRHLKKLEKQRYDVAVTSLGVNDTTGLVSVEKFLEGQAQLVELLQNKFGVNQVICSGLPPMHLFPALPQPLRWVMGRRALALNGALEQWISTQPNCSFLAGDFSLDPALMAPDGFHPGPELYRMWSEAVVRRIDNES